MFDNASIGLGAQYSPRKVQAYNRTGSTINRGQVAMVDILGTQAETTGTAPHSGNPAGAYANMTPVVQTAFEKGAPCYVCADETIADNALGWWYMWGEVEVAVCDDDVSTTDIDKGDAVTILVSESARAVQEVVTGGTGTRCVGLALEDAAADSTVTARTVDASSHLRYVLWLGGTPAFGVTDT